MNDFLIIDAGDIAVFINNMMVGIETKKEHNNIMEEILRKVAGNNLFVKPEKYM